VAQLQLDTSSMLYFQHRLGIMAQATALPGTVQNGMALQLPYGNQQLDETAKSLGKPLSPYENGWGLSSFLTHITTTAPDTIKAPAISDIQTKLKSQGLLPPGYNVTGTWDPESNYALGQYEQQAANDAYAGHHFLSTTTQKGLAALGWMLPSEVFQGIVGAAKGFVQQAPETAARVGLLGGAASGAAIGAAAGAVFGGVGAAPGAVIGAGVGAAVGFFGDLLSHDQSEGDQSPLQAIWDAVTPYQEYAGPGGAQKFFEDVGWVATAASLVGGVGSGIKAAAAGVAGIEAGAESAGTDFLTQAFAKAPTGDIGWSSKLLAQPAKFFGADRYSQMTAMFEAHGFMAQASRPILSQVVTPLFTGISGAQVGARLTANLGAGATKSTIAQAIADTPQLKSGIETPLGDAVDLASFVIAPTQFLPWKLGDLTRGAQAFAQTDAAFDPLVNIARDIDPTLSYTQGAEKAKSWLGTTDAEQVGQLQWLHLQHGINTMALRDTLLETGGRAHPQFDATLAANKFHIAEKINGELESTFGSSSGEALSRGSAAAIEQNRAAATATGKPSLLKSLDAPADMTTQTPTLQEAMGYAFNDPAGIDKSRGPAAFEAYVRQLLPNDAGPDAFGNYLSATQTTKELTNNWRAGQLVPLNVEGEMAGLPGVRNAGAKAVSQLRVARDNLGAEIKQLEATRVSVTDPQAVSEVVSQIDAKKANLKDLEGALKSAMTKRKATPEDLVVVPERLDTPTASDYQDRQMEYAQLTSAMEVALHDGDQGAYARLAGEYSDWLDRWEHLIPDKLWEKAKAPKIGEGPSGAIADHFESMARHAPQEIRFSPVDQGGAFGEANDTAQKLADMGYKAVFRQSRSTLEYGIDPRIMEVTGINDVSRRPAFYESLGFGNIERAIRRGVGNATVNTPQAQISKLQSLATEKSLDQLSAEKDWGLTGSNMMGRLHRSLDQANNAGVVTNEVARGLELRPEGAAPVVAGFIKGPGATLRHFAVDPRDLRPGDVYEAFRDIKGFTHDDAVSVFSAIQSGGAFGAEVNFRHPLEAAHEIGRVMNVSGLQGFTDLARQWHFQDPGSELRGVKAFTNKGALKRIGISTAVGAGAGYVFGDDDKVGSAIHGAEVGLAVGLGTQMLAHRSYGFLPDYLHKVAMALRYSLSPSFDVRRFVKQNLLAATSDNLPPLLNGKRYVTRTGGDKAWEDATHFWNELNGIGYTPALDRFDRTLYAAGITGYNPMNRQIAHAWMMKNKGYSNGEISKALNDIYSYGIGRSALEKSVNYVFFPFSFEKKLLTSVGDFLLQNPGRSMLVYEGMRRFYASTWAKDVEGFLQDKVPLLSQLREFNAFSHGLSPGRFFLEGVDSHRTNVGKAAQILSTFFIPGGGAVTPLQEAVGGLGDLAVHAFSPVVITGESITKSGGDLKAENALDELSGMMQDYIPMVKDLNELYSNAYDQALVFAHGETPYSQLRDYYGEINGFKDNLKPLAQALGYTSTDGLLQSEQGIPYAQAYQNTLADAEHKYTNGAQLAKTFEDKQGIRDMALRDIMHSSNTSSAYDTVRQLAGMEQQFKLMAELTPASADVLHIAQGNAIRGLALEHADDPRFNELWNELFAYTYGPIRTVAA
jgi:hypothetical protein